MRINPNESALKYQKCIIKSHLGYFHHSNFKFSKQCYLHWWNMVVSWIMYMCFVYFMLFNFLPFSVISTTILRNQDFFFSTIVKGKMVSHDPQSGKYPVTITVLLKNIRVSLLWFTIKHCPAPAEQLNILFILLIYFFTVSSLSLN